MADPIEKNDEGSSFAVRFRGYDRKQVDAFLRDAAAELHRLLAARTSSEPEDKPYLQVGKEIADLLEHARYKADQVVKKAEMEGEKILQEAEGAARRIKEEAVRIKMKAEREARSIVDGAHKTAQRLRHEADHLKRLARAELSVAHEEAHAAAKQLTDEAKKAADEIRAAARVEADRKIEEAEDRLRRLRTTDSASGLAEPSPPSSIESDESRAQERIRLNPRPEGSIPS